MAFMFLFIAFVLPFVPLFQDQYAFSHPSIAMKVFVMMLGEIEYDALFKNCEEDVCPEVLFPGTSHILVAFFILMISMVLMNVLFGMAVADIQVNNVIRECNKKIISLVKYLCGSHFLDYSLLPQKVEMTFSL